MDITRIFASHIKNKMVTRRKRISFRATKIVKNPTTVRFRTTSGQNVSFKATRLVRKPATVSFHAKRKKKK